MKESILVIIPAFNEARSIGMVLADISKEFVSEVVVVNNGSTREKSDLSALQLL